MLTLSRCSFVLLKRSSLCFETVMTIDTFYLFGRYSKQLLRKTVENLLENFLATQCSESHLLVQKIKVMKMGQFWQFEFSCLNWLFFGAQNVWILPDKIGVFQFIHLWFFRQNLVFGMKNQTFRTFLAPKLKFFIGILAPKFK